MVFVLWVPVLWSAWSSFCVVFLCCLGGFPVGFGGVGCVVLSRCPLGLFIVCCFGASGLKCVSEFRGLMCVLSFSLFLGFASLFASDAFWGVFRSCAWSCFGVLGVWGCVGLMV